MTTKLVTTPNVTTKKNSPSIPDEGVSTFRQYRAPRRNQEVFVDPPLNQAAALLAGNRQLIATYDSRWQAMRGEARKQLLTDAIRYTSVYRDTSWVDRDPERAIIMAGHQPSLFHPGVWFKNFALSHLATDLNATAVNLVVDNDVAKNSAVRVPTIDETTGLAAFRAIPYDQAGGGVPYEQTTVGDLQLFDRFDANVAKAVRPLVKDPCVHQLWRHARAAIGRCGVAGCALAQARHGLEGEIGLQTLELPLGVFCRGRAFAEFALSILTEMPRFQKSYNDSAHDYRVAHGIRSTAHPVPDLAEKDGWFEAPLWIYGNLSPHRKAAWVRMQDDYLEISDLGNRLVRINTRHLSDAVDQLTAAMTPEFKLRPRALLTTMYSRLVLSDLFLHGIGGGKYDQLGDMVTESFFGIKPPSFMVTSATIHLPGVQVTDIDEEVRGLKRKIRETHYQGERFAPTASDTTAGNTATDATTINIDHELVEQKQALLRTVPPRGKRVEWHREITEVNYKLSDQLSDVRRELQSELAVAQRKAVGQSILQSREHSFSVFPLPYLTDSFKRMLGQ